MNALVLDCSVTMAWCFEDECDELADAVLGVFGETEVWVPALWPIEVANVLLVAERRGRLTSAGSARFIELLSGQEPMSAPWDRYCPPAASWVFRRTMRPTSTSRSATVVWWRRATRA